MVSLTVPFSGSYTVVLQKSSKLPFRNDSTSLENGTPKDPGNISPIQPVCIYSAVLLLPKNGIFHIFLIQKIRKGYTAANGIILTRLFIGPVREIWAK